MLFIFDLMKIVVKIKNLTLVLGTIIFIVLSSFIVHYLEPETFPTLFLGFWYVMTTITTTGYGDFVPQTVAGKWFALFLYLFGITLIGVFIGKMVEGIGVYRKLKEEGKLRFKGSGHYVIIGWSQKAQKTIDELLLAKEKANILIIDLHHVTPYDKEQIHFIHGDATDSDTLEKANITKADSVLIFAPDTINDPISVDGRSLLIASSIEHLASKKKKDIYTIVEIVRESHIPTFKHACVDEFVLSSEAFSDLMAKSALHKGSTKVFMQLLSREYGDNVWEIEKNPNWKTYNDAFESLKQIGANLLSDRNDFSIIRRLQDEVPDNAKLYVICDEPTYQKIKLM
ncbi:potassium channel family protein [Alkalihalobacterium chitinilyticum]|uniref:Potassium channel family protein n=1 Tax=Alkalihalobacterium chitinilyticum TaxID=2980103 RepID=A0ABT5VHG4_9BACI|nr:potassium channel family protein [Alkalihalobacterium chitinilyticum]MDE5414889.1 potassium channel family protein [Alkalihalobacterium chitinilyticum]